MHIKTYVLRSGQASLSGHSNWTEVYITIDFCQMGMLKNVSLAVVVQCILTAESCSRNAIAQWEGLNVWTEEFVNFE